MIINQHMLCIINIIKSYPKPSKTSMLDIIFPILAYILFFEIIVFLLLTLPLPHRFKAKIIKVVIGSKAMKKVLWVHLGICIIAGMFYADLQQSETLYGKEKQMLRKKNDGHIGAEARVSFLSYQIQRIQRNKYITFMVIYATIALNVYLRLLYHIYEKRGDLQTDQKDIAASTGRQSTGSQPRLSAK